MKKITSSLLLAGTLLTVSSQAGVLLDIEAGVGTWNAKTSGDMNYKNETTIDLDKDLGLADNSNNMYFYADIDHFIPIIPNIKLERQNYTTDGNSTISQNITFGGKTYNASEKLSSELQLNQTDLTLYWGVPGLNALSLGILDIDLGITAKKFDGYAEINGATTGVKKVDIDFTAPMGYLAARVNVPLIDTQIYASTKMISYKDSQLSDTSIKVSYKLPIPVPVIDFKLDIGYKIQKLKITDDLSDDFNADIETKGIFGGITAKF